MRGQREREVKDQYTGPLGPPWFPWRSSGAMATPQLPKIAHCSVNCIPPPSPRARTAQARAPCNNSSLAAVARVNKRTHTHTHKKFAWNVSFKMRPLVLGSNGKTGLVQSNVEERCFCLEHSWKLWSTFTFAPFGLIERASKLGPRFVRRSKRERESLVNYRRVLTKKMMVLEWGHHLPCRDL